MRLKVRSSSDAFGIILATVCGAGFFPIWPGTVGSALGLVPVLLLQGVAPATKIGCYILLFAAFVWAAHRAERVLGGVDHRSIVCDETCGMAVVWELTSNELPWMMASFVVFRMLDALKPGIISSIERRTSGGLGIMLDDVAAAAGAVAMIVALHAII